MRKLDDKCVSSLHDVDAVYVKASIVAKKSLNGDLVEEKDTLSSKVMQERNIQTPQLSFLEKN